MLAVASGRSVRLSLVAIQEGVHLLFDNIGDLTDGTSKQLRVFEQRQSNFGITVGMHEFLHDLFEITPHAGCVRQDVVHSAYGFQVHRTNQELTIATRTVRFALVGAGNT